MSDPREFKYSGTHILLATETTLANYNKWIATQFANCYRASRGGAVLDFGAGVGSLAMLFRNMTGTTPVTLEVDPEQRATLEKRGFHAAKSLSELNEEFDFIYTSNVLEHIVDDIETLRNLRRKMSRNSKIAIFVPAFEIIWTSLDDKVGHQRRYTKKTLTECLREAGFEIEEIGYRDSVGFMLAIIFKFIGSKSGEPGATSLIIFDKMLLPISRLLDKITSPFFGKNLFAIGHPY